MKKKFYAYLHTHWDLEWYRDIEDFNLRFLDVFDIVLDELKNNRAPFFYLDGQVVALLNYLKYRPHKKEEIKNLIKEKKLAIGPYCVIADSYLINFSSMMKNLELGLKISSDFNQKDFIGYLSDIFGVSKSAFEALKLNSINYASIWRGVNPSAINNNCNFTLDSIKTVWLAQGYFNDFLNAKETNIEAFKKYLDKISQYSPDIALLPIGADHLGMLKDANRKIEEINKKFNDYEIILTNPFEYFKKADFNNTSNTEEFLDNAVTYTLAGVYSARIYQKIKNNEIQNKLSRIVEPLNFFLKDNFTSQIEDVYKTLILNHAHDGIYGCSIDSVHKTIDSRLLECELKLDAILKRLIYNFKTKHNLKAKSKETLGLFNLSNFNNIKTIKLELPYKLPYSQVIKTERKFPNELYDDIYHIPITEEIKPIYTQIVEISDNEKFAFNTVKILKPAKKVKIDQNSIENEFIKLEVVNNKIIISNEFDSFNLKITDVADFGDTYNSSPEGKYDELELIKTRVIVDGAIESKLRLYFKNLELDVILNNHAKFLKFNFKINNKKKNHKLEASFILNRPITNTLAQDAIGTIKRGHEANYDIRNYMPCSRPVELKTNTYPMQNFVIADNLTVLTKGLNEYTTYKNELKICLLRSVGTISNPKNKTRSIPAGPNLATPEAQCLGIQEGEFALCFNKEEKEAFISLDEFLENYVALDGVNKENLNFKLDEIKPETYIYGISNNKKISYNFKDKTIDLI